ncbi:uncharacterized protein C19orf47 homolog [Manacus candei]|uniref:uncharacterized protein C19orf47 homolog n=1 Tax=Manacus candei TaxID=415023 RepID=UPI002226CBC4|nr:uncharacterized protein C19orf47 homolog [Manacus candei]
MATGEWLQFFQDAGIPPGPALGYAVAFVDNRIHKDMLLELTRELMKELGITVVGDVIAILRHARLVHSQELCRAASRELQPPPEPPPDRERGGDSAAGRMIRKSLSRDPPRDPPGTPRNPGSASPSAPGPARVRGRGGSSSPSVPGVAPGAGKRRRVTAEQEGRYRISLPKGTTARSRRILQLQAARGLGRMSVFERLGAEAKAEGKPSGVFGRLGAPPDPPQPSLDPPQEEEEEEPPEGPPLPYVGVLKRKSRECGGSGAPPDPGGAPPAPPQAQDGAVSSSGIPEFRGGRSVFRRLGRKQE